MHLLVLVLEQTEKLPDILVKLFHIGVKGTTVLESTGMARIFHEHNVDVPVIEYIDNILSGKHPSNKTLFTIIDEEKTVKRAISEIKSITGDLNEPGRGILFVVPISYAEGLKKYNHKSSR